MGKNWVGAYPRREPQAPSILKDFLYSNSSDFYRKGEETQSNPKILIWLESLALFVGVALLIKNQAFLCDLRGED